MMTPSLSVCVCACVCFKDDYLVDHTIIMYLMDPEFEFAQYFGQFMTAPEMAEGMEKTMREYVPPP